MQLACQKDAVEDRLVGSLATIGQTLMAGISDQNCTVMVPSIADALIDQDLGDRFWLGLIQKAAKRSFGIAHWITHILNVLE